MSCNDRCGFSNFWNRSTSNFTCQQLQDYCLRFMHWDKLCTGLKLSIDYTHILFGTVGVIGYIIMCMMYKMKSFNAVSFVYHRSMNYMEFVHMLVMIQSGIFMSRGYSDTYYYLLYRSIWCELWVFGDAMKLSVALLTAMVSFERAAAIWSDSTFKRINRPSVARAFVILSLIPGVLHLSPLLSAYPVPASPNSTLYIMVDNPLGMRINLASWNTIYALKIISSVVIAAFSIAVVIGLVTKSKKSSLLSANHQEKWKQSKMLCLLQLVMALSCLFDHTVWVANKMIKYETVYYTGVDAVERLTYESALWTLDRRLSFHITWVMESVCGEIDHGMRFFIYLICLKSMRDAFKKLVNSLRHGVAPLSVFTSTKSGTER